MTLKKIELHDALLKNMTIDYSANSIVISVDFYEKEADRERKPGVIIAEDVESLSQISNFEILAKSTFAGHIIQWFPSEAKGTTYIDLAGGCITITAKKVRFKPDN